MPKTAWPPLETPGLPTAPPQSGDTRTAPESVGTSVSEGLGTVDVRAKEMMVSDEGMIFTILFAWLSLCLCGGVVSCVLIILLADIRRIIFAAVTCLP